MASTHPTIVLIPGAWHSPIHYELVTKQLQAAHYDVVSSTLPSVGASDPNITTVTTDSTFISEKLIAPLLAEGKDIVLVMHSYGGSPGSVAAHGQSKTERTSKGLEGGITGIVFVAALLAPEGASLLTLLGGKFNDWVEVNTPPGYLTPSTPVEVFYNDVPEPLAKWAVPHLKLQSQTALSTPPAAPGWADPGFNGRRAYFHCLLDNCIPAAAQSGMMAGSNVTWDVHPFNTGHSPYLSEPTLVTQKIISLAEAWTQ